MDDPDFDDDPILDIDREGGDPGASSSASKGGRQQELRIDNELLEVMSGYDGRKVWLVKVPKFLQERWASQTIPDLHLATMRVYEPQPGQTQPKVSLILPPNPTYPTHDIPTEYDLVLAPSPVEAEEEERGTSSGLNGAKRQGFVLKEGEQRVEGRLNPTLFSKIHHEASLQPTLTPKYRALVRKRQELANKPKRTLKRLDEDALGEAKVAQMASGFGSVHGGGGIESKGKGRFGSFAKPPPRDRSLRLPRAELLDALFACFSSHPYWSLKALKEKTNQPEHWLKEVLADVGVLQKRGPYVGLWSLMEVYKGGLTGGSGVGGGGGGGSKVDGEGDGEVKGESEDGQGGLKGEEGEGGEGHVAGMAAAAGAGGDEDDDAFGSGDEEDSDEDMEEI